MQALTPAEVVAQKRRIRNTALKVAAFAVVVYFAFIVAFISKHS